MPYHLSVLTEMNRWKIKFIAIGQNIIVYWVHQNLKAIIFIEFDILLMQHLFNCFFLTSLFFFLGFLFVNVKRRHCNAPFINLFAQSAISSWVKLDLQSLQSQLALRWKTFGHNLNDHHLDYCHQYCGMNQKIFFRLKDSIS